MEKLYEVDGKVDCRWRLEGWRALVLGDGQCYRGVAARKRYRHTLICGPTVTFDLYGPKCQVALRNEPCYGRGRSQT